MDVLKIDVEGFEAAVLRGAERLLTFPNPPLIIFEFCDWAEKRVPGGQVGDAQRVLVDHGFLTWRISDFLRGKKPLADLLTTGTEMLVAMKA